MDYKQWLSENTNGTPLEYTKWCNTQNIVPNFYKVKSLSLANLTGANLRDAIFRCVSLEDANLERANLRRANLRDTKLKGANLVNANLKRANLSWADLVNANLKRANLVDANLEGADLEGADLEDANFWGTNLMGARGIVPIGGIGSELATIYFVKHGESCVMALDDHFWGTTYELIAKGYEYDTENGIAHDSPQSKGRAYQLASDLAIYTLAQQQMKES